MLECWCGVNQTGWSRYICCSSLGLHQHHQHFMMWRNSAIFHFSPLNYKDNKQERKRCEMRLTIWPMIPDVYNLSLRLRIWRNMRGSSDTPVVLWSTRITFIKYSRLKSQCGCWLARVHVPISWELGINPIDHKSWASLPGEHSLLSIKLVMWRYDGTIVRSNAMRVSSSITSLNVIRCLPHCSSLFLSAHCPD